MKCMQEITLCTFCQNSSDFPSRKAEELIINLNNFQQNTCVTGIIFGEYAIFGYLLISEVTNYTYNCEVWTFLLDNWEISNQMLWWLSLVI